MKAAMESEREDNMVLAAANNAAFQNERIVRENIGWIEWYLALEDHEFLLEVDLDFIKDKRNLLNLKREFYGNYKDSMKLILSNKVPLEEDLQD